jgi:hypothetical protein
MERKSSAAMTPEPVVAESLKNVYGFKDDEVTVLLSDPETSAFARELVDASTMSATSLARTREAINNLRRILKQSYGVSFLKYALRND